MVLLVQLEEATTMVRTSMCTLNTPVATREG